MIIVNVFNIVKGEYEFLGMSCAVTPTNYLLFHPYMCLHGCMNFGHCFIYEVGWKPILRTWILLKLRCFWISFEWNAFLKLLNHDYVFILQSFNFILSVSPLFKLLCWSGHYENNLQWNKIPNLSSFDTSRTMNIWYIMDKLKLFFPYK